MAYHPQPFRLFSHRRDTATPTSSSRYVMSCHVNVELQDIDRRGDCGIWSICVHAGRWGKATAPFGTPMAPNDAIARRRARAVPALPPRSCRLLLGFVPVRGISAEAKKFDDLYDLVTSRNLPFSWRGLFIARRNRHGRLRRTTTPAERRRGHGGSVNAPPVHIMTSRNDRCRPLAGSLARAPAAAAVRSTPTPHPTTQSALPTMPPNGSLNETERRTISFVQLD